MTKPMLIHPQILACLAEDKALEHRLRHIFRSLDCKDNGDDSKGKINPRTNKKPKTVERIAKTKWLEGEGCCCLAKYSSIF